MPADRRVEPACPKSTPPELSPGPEFRISPAPLLDPEGLDNRAFIDSQDTRLLPR